MPTCPSLPIELWALILDFAALLNDPHLLLAFNEINRTTRNLLKDPNHKHWTTSFANTPKLHMTGVKHKPAFLITLTTHHGARACLRLFRLNKCMVCDTTENVILYVRLFKNLCLYCFHEFTMTPQAVTRFFEGYAEGARVQNAHTLPWLDPMTKSYTVLQHIWRADFMALGRERKVLFEGEETFEEYEERKMRLIEAKREKDAEWWMGSKIRNKQIAARRLH